MPTVDDVLAELERAKHRAYGITLQAQAAIEEVCGSHFDRERIEAVAVTISIDAELEAIRTTLALVALTSELTESQKVELVRAPDQTYESYLAGDLSLVDELSLKTQAFMYIVAPSSDVIAAHEFHRERLDRFDRDQ
jgi:hypothetical protein